MTTMYNSNTLNSRKNERNKDKFSMSNSPKVEPKFNEILNGLVNTKNWFYGSETVPFVNALKDEQLCHYQSNLIDAYLKRPDTNLKLDCDYISLTMKARKKDVTRLLEDGGIMKHRIKSMSSLFTVKDVPVGKVNNDGSCGPKRPYYTHAFNLTISGGANVKFYIADGSGHDSGIIGLKIDFIPNQLSDFEFRCVFGHFKSALTHERYNTLILKARVTRVDVGFNMFGVFSAFVFITLSNNWTKISTGFPRGDGSQMIESSYLGCKKNSSYTIAYDKSLKVMVDLKNSGSMSGSELLSHHNTQAATTRIEYKYYPYRSNGILLLDNICDANIRLGDVRIIDPNVLCHSPEDLLANLLRDKTIQAVKHQKPHMKKAVKGKCKARTVSLDNDWVEQECSKLLTHYQKLVMTPKTVKSHEISEYLVTL
jgi:hypothetical protein